jgi:predicted ATPase
MSPAGDNTMIKKIRIRNFKAFQDSGEIEIKPITVLIGANSSGKSSIMQALLVLRQTMESRDTEVPLHVVGDYVDLGSYVDCVYQHRIAEKHQAFLSLDFALELGLSGAFWRYRVPSGILDAVSKKLDFQRMEVSTAFGYNKKARTIYLRNFRVKDTNDTVALHVRANASGQVLEARSEAVAADFSSKAVVKSFSKNLHRLKFFYEYRQRVRLSKIPSRDQSYAEERQLGAFTSACYDAAQREFAGVFYLGPLRRRTQRFNPITGETPQDVGFEGENALKVVYRDFKASKKQSIRLVGKLRHWLKRFNVASDLKVVTLPGNHFTLNIVDSNNNATVNLCDVGFGVSQVLPIIVEGFYAPKDSMILVEQPEIHLHPALQSELADLLMAFSMENKIVVLETHSEHLLLRLQKRIAEGKLDPARVAIYFVKSTSNGSVVQRIDLNQYGQFVNWPAGFFEEDIEEGLDHLKEISKKMKANLVLES